MLGNPAWALEHWALITAVVTAIVLGKAVVLCGVAYLFRSSPGHAVATGICLAQVGEFSFVLAEVARRERVIDSDLFELVVTATIGTLFLTPYLVAAAPRMGSAAGRLLARRTQALHLSDEMFEQPAGKSGHIVIVGFGPAGQRVAETLMRRQKSLIVVVELNTKTADVARTYGLQTIIGDATRTEVLEHLRVQSASVVVITVPEPATARQIVELVRSLAPDTAIIARARYHIHQWQLLLAGAHTVVDEEEEVGRRIAFEVRRKLRSVGDKDNQ
jgi:CPA2 family monovalent cation:H+ antiporter-2